MRPALVTALILCGICALSSQAQAEEAKGVYERDAVDVEAPDGVEIASVVVDNRLGDVSVRGHDRPGIAIQSFKRALDKETLDRLVVSLVPDASGRVQIRTTLRAGAEARPIAAGSIAVDLVVFVPHSTVLEAELWKGNLRVSGLDNGAKLLVDDGRIEVKHVSGVIVSDLRRGEQEFTQVLGELVASGIAGELRLDTVRGKRLEAKLVRGTIVGEGLKVDAMTMQSVFGDIELVVEPKLGGKYQVSSRKGDVSVRFHGATPVTMEVIAAKVMLGAELNASRPAEGAPWRGQFGRFASTRSKVRPAQLEIRAGAGKVVVRHF
ncbi:MAG: hypothetical protein GY811_13005 [Myxococcales bacterium]|nr:hypothetical protein [Myxococcales bacterium]